MRGTTVLGIDLKAQVVTKRGYTVYNFLYFLCFLNLYARLTLNNQRKPQAGTMRCTRSKARAHDKPPPQVRGDAPGPGDPHTFIS